MTQKVILMVDNHVEYLKTMEEYVRAAGYKVCLATTPDEARSLIQRKKIDLAVIDLRLVNDNDVMDNTGLFLAKDLHPKMPVIMWTSFTTYESARQALYRHEKGEAYADDYIAKNDGSAELISTINRLINLQDQEPKSKKRALILRNIQLITGVVFIVMVIVFLVLGLFKQDLILIITLILGAFQVLLASLALIFQKSEK